MDKVAIHSRNDRADLFNETGRRVNLRAELVEKDFWACWCLHKLFGPQLATLGLLFKGGTSLSKVFSAIDRFSQDIDLSIDRAMLGFGGENDPLNMEAKNQRRRVLPKLQEAMNACVGDQVLPTLKAIFTEKLASSGETWNLALRSCGDEAEIMFEYPAASESSSSLVRPEVLMQFGARSARSPILQGSVSPYAAEAFPEQFENDICLITTLGIDRTFWEKVVLVHMLCLKDAPRTEAMSRHYSDLANLAAREDCIKAIDDDDMLGSTVAYQRKLYAVSASACDSMTRGNFRLSPEGDLRTALSADYAKYQDIYFGEPPPFDSIAARLEALEEKINELK